MMQVVEDSLKAALSQGSIEEKTIKQDVEKLILNSDLRKVGSLRIGIL